MWSFSPDPINPECMPGCVKVCKEALTHLDGMCEGHGHFAKADVCQQVAERMDHCEWQHSLDLYQQSNTELVSDPALCARITT